MRAVIYIRVSSKEQVSNFSLATQLKACREYCKHHGLQIVEVFEDAGESAKTTDRPEFQRLDARTADARSPCSTRSKDS
jgi:DNA invertase Pin-like site-specific DNA recombinase